MTSAELVARALAGLTAVVVTGWFVASIAIPLAGVVKEMNK